VAQNLVWGTPSELAQQYLTKGSLIFIEGTQPVPREWQERRQKAPALKS